MITMGIDAGTQSIKVLIYDFDKGSIAGESSEKLELISLPGGVREQKAEWWINAIDSCLSRIPRELLSKVEAISVSGQQHGFVPVGASGEVLYNVKLWCDTSTAEECNELTALYGGADKLVSELGNPILPGYTVGKIYWLKKHHPEIFSQLDKVMLPHDYLNYYLSGVYYMERGDASGTGLMNIFNGKWDEKLCALIDPSLISKLPKVISEPGVVGKVRTELCEKYGFNEQAVVVSGGGDNMMSAFGTGAVSDGKVTMSLGTSGTLFSSSSKAVVDKAGRLAAFCSSHGTWLPLLCTMNCTVASEVMRKYMDLDVKSFDSLAESAPVGAEGIIFLPFLNGERSPDLPNGKGLLSGITPDNISNANIARATLEGVTYEFLLGLEAFASLGVGCKEITLTGGGAKSRFWRQLIADMTGCEVRVPAISETAAFGSALQACWLLSGEKLETLSERYFRYDESKSASPDKEKHESYKKLYKEWLAMVEAVTPIFK